MKYYAPNRINVHKSYFLRKGQSQGHKVIDFESFEKASLVEIGCQISKFFLLRFKIQKL